MPDRFRQGRDALDTAEAPDLWGEAVSRTELDIVPMSDGHRRAPWRALAVAATVLVLLAATTLLADRDDGQVASTPDVEDPATTTGEPCRPPGTPPALLATTSPPEGFDPASHRTRPATGGPGAPPHSLAYFDGAGEAAIDVFDGPPPEPADERGVQTPVGFAQVGERDGEVVAALDLEAFGVSCTLGLIGHGLSVDAMYELLSGLFLADELGRPLLHPDGAVWPETAGLTASMDQPAWRSDARDTALEFARQVLGWEDAVAPVELSEPSEDGRFGADIGVVRSDHPGRASVSVAPTLGGRWLGVYAVDLCCATADEAENPDFGSVQILLEEQTGQALAGPVPDGAVSHGVRFDHGGRIATAEFAIVDDGAAVDLGYSPDTTGSALVLFRDTDGEVLSAWGRPIPAGDFAAG